jgi:hypothetical protein
VESETVALQEKAAMPVVPLVTADGPAGEDEDEDADVEGDEVTVCGEFFCGELL